MSTNKPLYDVLGAIHRGKTLDGAAKFGFLNSCQEAGLIIMNHMLPVLFKEDWGTG
jgi:hypothetical protein